MNSVARDKWYWLTLLAGAVVFYVLNVFTPMIGDDILFTLVPGNESQPCNTLGQYIASMPYFYCDNNGRIADMVVRFICSLLGKGVFNVLNTIVFVAFMHVLSKHIDDSNRRVWHLCAAMLYMLVLMPVAGQTMLWIAGTVNYLWSSTATLALLLVYRRKRIAVPAAVLCLLLIGAFVAGGMNESISSATLAGLVCYSVLNRKSVTWSHMAILLAYFAGFMVIVLSPAAWNRLETGNSVNVNMGVMAMLVQRSLNLVTKTGHFVTPFLGLCALAVMCRVKGIKETSGEMINWCLVGAVISVFVFGVYSKRAYTWYSVMGLVVALKALAPFIDEHRKVAVALCTVCALGCIGASAHAVRTIHAYRVYSDSVMSAIKASPDGVILAPKAMTESRYVHPMSFSNERYTAYNRFLGYYLGKPNVQFLPDSVFSRYRGKQPFMQGASVINGIESSDSSVVAAVYAMGDAGFSVAPVTGADYTPGRPVKMYYSDIDSYLGKERADKRRMWGVMKDYTVYNSYALERDGERYIILPALSDSIVALEVPVTVGGEKRTIKLTRKTQDNG